MLAAHMAGKLLPWSTADFTHMRSRMPSIRSYRQEADGTRSSRSTSETAGILGLRLARDAVGHMYDLVYYWTPFNESKTTWKTMNTFTEKHFPNFDVEGHVEVSDMVKGGKEAFTQVFKKAHIMFDKFHRKLNLKSGAAQAAYEELLLAQTDAAFDEKLDR